MSSHEQFFLRHFQWACLPICGSIYQFFRHLAVSWEGDVMGAHAQNAFLSPVAWDATRVQKCR